MRHERGRDLRVMGAEFGGQATTRVPYHESPNEVLDNLKQDNLALICVRNSRESSVANIFVTDYRTAGLR